MEIEEVKTIHDEIKQLNDAIAKINARLEKLPEEKQDPYDLELIDSLQNRVSELEDRLNRKEAAQAPAEDQPAEEPPAEDPENNDEGEDEDDDLFI